MQVLLIGLKKTLVEEKTKLNIPNTRWDVHRKHSYISNQVRPKDLDNIYLDKKK